MSGYSDFTAAQRAAFVYGAGAAARGERDARMSQAEAHHCRRQILVLELMMRDRDVTSDLIPARKSPARNGG